MTIIIFITCWLLCAPLGYLAHRWLNRVIGISSWTCMDRIGAIFFAVINGPMTIVFAIVFVLLEKLGECDWAKREAKW